MKAIYTRPETKVILADMPVILSGSDPKNGISETNLDIQVNTNKIGGNNPYLNFRPNAKENNGGGIWDE